ncbi:ParB/RepB/Spo0J family partition protein [Sinorhizobium meliloti]|uniref:ParB/RepB/Spo0J family partition protein n=1 Tax=Rhizobium meliloti TaxID=382 RepID=UPI001F2D3032|nr:ParB/RepB/Spo0J family partition protein [Sinorhizobium meliloti]
MKSAKATTVGTGESTSLLTATYKPSQSAIVPLKSLPEGARESRKFAQVLSSIKAIGLVEAPVVIADTRSAGTWYLLDGHLRLEALKELGFAEVECLVAIDDDTYTTTSGSTGWPRSRSTG